MTAVFAEKKALLLNLLTLGFDVNYEETKNGCLFNEKMFDKPNKRAFEVVCHFLFDKLNHKQATELFRTCFPAINKKSTLEFRKVSYTWLKRLTEENRNFSFPKVNTTLLMSPGGPEFIHLMFQFSNFVMFHIASKTCGSEILSPPPATSNKDPPWRSSLMMKSIDAMIHHEFEELRLEMMRIKETEQDEQIFASQEMERHHSMKRKIKHLKHQLNHSSQKRLLNTDQKHKETMKKKKKDSNEKLALARKLWDRVSQYYTFNRQFAEIFSSALMKTSERIRLDSNVLQPRVPAKLLDECQTEIYQTVGTSLYQGGDLNLQSLVSLSNLAIMLVTDKLHECGIPNFEKYDKQLESHLKLRDDEMLKIHEIRKQLVILVPRLVEANQERQKKLGEVFGEPEKQNDLADSLNTESDDESYEKDKNDFDYSKGLSKMYLLPSDHSIESFFQEELDKNVPSNANNDSPNLDSTFLSWSVPLGGLKSSQKPKKTKLTAGSSPFKKPAEKVESRHRMKKLAQNSLTPDRQKRSKVKSRGRKSMSLPSSPMTSQSSKSDPNSRSYFAQSKLIDDIVNLTVQEGAASNIIYYQDDDSQLDETAFVSADKIPRTPTSDPNNTQDLTKFSPIVTTQTTEQSFHVLENLDSSTYSTKGKRIQSLSSEEQSEVEEDTASQTEEDILSRQDYFASPINLQSDNRLKSSSSSLCQVNEEDLSSKYSTDDPDELQMATLCSPNPTGMRSSFLPLSSSEEESPPGEIPAHTDQIKMNLQTPTITPAGIPFNVKDNVFFTPGKPPVFELIELSDEETERESPLIRFDDEIGISLGEPNEDIKEAGRNPIDILMETPPPISHTLKS